MNFFIEQALPEVSLHLINASEHFGYIKFGFRNDNMELNDRKRIGQVKEMVLNEASDMAMTFQIKAY